MSRTKIKIFDAIMAQLVNKMAVKLSRRWRRVEAVVAQSYRRVVQLPSNMRDTAWSCKKSICITEKKYVYLINNSSIKPKHVHLQSSSSITRYSSLKKWTEYEYESNELNLYGFTNRHPTQPSGSIIRPAGWYCIKLYWRLIHVYL